MGYLFAKHARSLAAKRTPLMIAGALLWAALLPLIWPVLVPEANWWYPSLRAWLHARGLPGAVVLLYGVRYLCAAGALVALFYAYDHVKGRALTLQAWIGRRTLGMYVIQPFFLLAASAWTHDWVVLAVVAFVGSLGATWLLELTPLTRLVMLGQRSRPRVQSTS